MRVAFFSDIHGNLPALEAALADARAHHATHLICLGDIVGYGPQPVETLAQVRAIADAVVLGNHDAVACGMLNPALFNPFARETTERASLALSDEDKAWLRGLPMIVEDKAFACAHGTLDAPDSFCYLESRKDAARSLDALPHVPLLVVGHTHIPCLFLQDGETGEIRKLPPEDIGLPPGARAVINPGSIGFPRSNTLAAHYAIYDTVTRHLLFRAVPYDLTPYRLAVVRGGYNILNYWFLSPAARRRQTELAFLNPARAAAPLGEGQAFRRRRTTGLTHTSTVWLLVLLLVSLIGLGALLLIVSAPPDETAQTQTVSETENRLPPVGDWVFTSQGGVVELLTAPNNSLRFIPLDSPFFSCTAFSPLAEVPPGAEKLRLSFQVKTAAERELSYTTRVHFVREDGSTRTDRAHSYKRADIQGYSVPVPRKARQFRVEFRIECQSRAELISPVLRVSEWE